MKKILLSISCLAIAVHTQALDFTVATLNMYMFCPGMVGKLQTGIDPQKITWFNNVLTNKNPRPSGPDNNVTIPGLKDIDIMCFQEWPSNFGSNTPPQFPVHYKGNAISYSGTMCVLTMINTQKFAIVEPTKQLPNITGFSPYWPQTVTVIQPNGTSIKIGVINAHLKGGVSPEQTVQQADNISKYIAQRPDVTHWIVCGDFNMRGKYKQVMSTLNLNEVDGPSGSTVTEYNESVGYARLDGIFYSANTITKISHDQYPLNLQAFIGGKGLGLYNHWITDHALIRASFKIPDMVATKTPAPHIISPITPTFSLDATGMNEPFLFGTITKVAYATIAQQSYNPAQDDYTNGGSYQIGGKKIKVKWYPKTNKGQAQIDDNPAISIELHSNGLGLGGYTIPSGTTIISYSMSPQWPMRAIATIVYEMMQDYATRTKTAPIPTLLDAQISEDLTKLAESLHELHGAGTPPQQPPTSTTSKSSPYTQVYKGVTITVEKGDILQSNVTAIVNAANEPCTGGGGIDGAITSIGGGYKAQKRDLIKPRTGKFTGQPAVCPTGEARLTISGNIKSIFGIPYVLQATGPICSGNGDVESHPGALAGAYENSLITAHDFNLYLKDHNNRGHDEFANVSEATPITSVAFPAISGNIYGCSPDFVAKQAAMAIQKFVSSHPATAIKTIKILLLDSPEKVTILFAEFVNAIQSLS